MFNKVALSILFTANGIHNVNGGKRGDDCSGLVWCDGDLHCHKVSWNGRYRRDGEGELVGQKRCVFENEKDISKGADCISDHECDYEYRNAHKDEENMMTNPGMVCKIDETAASLNPNITGKCTKPSKAPKEKPAREEDQYRGQHGMACKGKRSEECDSGLVCMHPHKVILDGCYAPASTVRDGQYCFDHVECMDDSQCQTFSVPLYTKMSNGHVKKKSFPRQLCAKKGSMTVSTHVPTKGMMTVTAVLPDQTTGTRPDIQEWIDKQPTSKDSIEGVPVPVVTGQIVDEQHSKGASWEYADTISPRTPPSSIAHDSDGTDVQSMDTSEASSARSFQPTKFPTALPSKKEKTIKV